MTTKLLEPSQEGNGRTAPFLLCQNDHYVRCLVSEIVFNRACLDRGISLAERTLDCGLIVVLKIK